MRLQSSDTMTEPSKEFTCVGTVKGTIKGDYEHSLHKPDIERESVNNLLSLVSSASLVTYITRTARLNNEKVHLLIELRKLEYHLSLLAG